MFLPLKNTWRAILHTALDALALENPTEASTLMDLVNYQYLMTRAIALLSNLAFLSP